ncbi:MAG: aldo/keto reductase [Chloroflexales bacterium]|nr:aldo/keto reductase [Chloroflexales bacterium]
MTIPSVKLNNGLQMPQIGLGTASLDDDAVAPVIVSAIEAGYRHIDTAFRYGNQRGVGKGVRDSGNAREQLFVTTKLDGEFQGQNRAIVGLDECLQQLQMDYVDLLLIHWPLPQRNEYVSTWKTFETLVASGKVRSIGVSNFTPAHLEMLHAQTTIRPTTNQIQLSPRITRPDQVAYGHVHNIVTVSWSPLGQGGDLLSDLTLKAIAHAHGRSIAQIVLRWNIELGLVPIPRSANPVRLAQNLEIFDFALTPAQIAAITALDTGAEKRVDSDVQGH